MSEIIPLFRPSCTDAEISAVTDVLRSGWWGMGPKTAEFEVAFAARVGARHAVAVNSCTAALQLACEAMGVAGGTVIMPALTFASTALAVMHAGGLPVFADIDPVSLCVDWRDVARKTTVHTRAVIPVWYGGMVTGAATALPVIEDCAHACGSVGAGEQGQVACWSFQAVKNLATGDGGMITTNDGELAAKLRRLRWCGIDRSTWDRDQGRYGWEYDIREPGHKMHMNDLTAALGLAQLERLDEMNEARRLRVRQYLEAFKDTAWMQLPAYWEGSSWHLFCVRVAGRDRFVSHMTSAGVSAGVHYKPLNTYPLFDTSPLPVTDRVWREIVTLPLYPDMTDADLARVVETAKAFRP